MLRDIYFSVSCPDIVVSSSFCWSSRWATGLLGHMWQCKHHVLRPFCEMRPSLPDLAVIDRDRWSHS